MSLQVLPHPSVLGRETGELRVRCALCTHHWDSVTPKQLRRELVALGWSYVPWYGGKMRERRDRGRHRWLCHRCTVKWHRDRRALDRAAPPPAAAPVVPPERQRFSEAELARFAVERERRSAQPPTPERLALIWDLYQQGGIAEVVDGYGATEDEARALVALADPGG